MFDFVFHKLGDLISYHIQRGSSKGAVLGCAVGACAGAAIGFGIGTLGWVEEEFRYSPIVVGVLLGAIVGALVGAKIGPLPSASITLTSHSEEFEVSLLNKGLVLPFLSFAAFGLAVLMNFLPTKPGGDSPEDIRRMTFILIGVGIALFLWGLRSFRKVIVGDRLTFVRFLGERHVEYASITSWYFCPEHEDLGILRIDQPAQDPCDLVIKTRDRFKFKTTLRGHGLTAFVEALHDNCHDAADRSGFDRLRAFQVERGELDDLKDFARDAWRKKSGTGLD